MYIVNFSVYGILLLVYLYNTIINLKALCVVGTIAEMHDLEAYIIGSTNTIVLHKP